nr:fibronectin type III domain-containing protein [Kibdelosporangium sp. MJ126-NF4]
MTRGIAAAAAAALVLTGTVSASSASVAVQGQLTQTYSCPFPLIGNQNVTVEITAEQPATIATGQFTPPINVKAVANAGKTATEGLRLVGAESIRGSARATSTVTAPADQGALTVQVPTSIPQQLIPAVGNDLVVNAEGAAPGLRFDKPGTATLSVTALEMEMTPLRADGTPTDLGTFNSVCTLNAGQSTLLHSYAVTGNEVIPEAVVGQGNVPPLKQTYTCPFPLIGNQDVTVDIQTALPTKAKVGEFLPKIDITAVANAGTTATQGLRLVSAETIQGLARATSLVSAPQGHLAVQVPTDIPNQPIPAVGNPLIVNAKGSAPALKFDKPGTATLSVHDLVMVMTPLKADGTPTGLGTFTSDCTLKDGQTNVLHTFTIETGVDTEKPSVPQNLRKGDVTPTSVGLVWDASSDNVGVSGYEVFVNGQSRATVTGTAATVDGLTADTEYSFTVVAKDAAGNKSDPSAALTVRTATAPDTAAPSVPQNVKASGVTETSAVLTWDASSDNVGVSGYEVFVNGQSKASVPGTTATVEGLTPDTDYTVTVIAKDAAGNKSDSSAPLTVHTASSPDTVAPSVPQNVKATGATENTIALSWDASSDNVGVTGYEVFVNGQSKTTVAGTTTTVEGLTPDTEYSITVSAKDAAGNKSAQSTPVPGKTLPAPDRETPSVPQNVKAGGATPASVALTWDASSDNVGVTGYEVFVNGQSKASVSGTTATIDGLAEDTEYTFTVIAKDAAGNKSAPSAAVKARTLKNPDVTPPTAPTDVRATGVTETSIALAWNASTDDTGVTGYDVFVNGTPKTSAPGTTATVDSLTKGTEYTITVKAKDAAGNVSSPSVAIKVTTTSVDGESPTTPGNVRATGTTDTGITLAWDASSDNVGVVGYEVYNGSTVIPTTATTATVTALTPDTEYTFTVKAKDAAGNVSAASAPVKARTKPRDNNEIPYTFALDGKTRVKAANGTVPLSGGVAVLFTPGTGAFHGDLRLDPTRGQFRLFGFIPVSARIEFVPAGQTTGTLSGDGVLRAKSSVTVKLPRVSLFGFPISSSPTCQTRTPVDVPLVSKPGFTPLSGGSLSGTYTLPAVQGCGPLTPLISAFTEGPGNTIQVSLNRTVKATR